MPVYTVCGSCKGARTFACSACVCKECTGGKVESLCPKCLGNARVRCESCQGEGRRLAKKGWFSDTYAQCWDCEGTRQRKCSCITGSVLVACPSCKGTSRSAQCATCAGTGKLKCSTCKGKGRVESEWYKSLSSMPVDQLKFEHQKRQQQVSVLEMKRMNLQRQYDAIQEMWAEESANLHTARDYQNYNPPSTSGIENEMSTVSSKISSVTEEISAIEKALDAKWA